MGCGPSKNSVSTNFDARPTPRAPKAELRKLPTLLAPVSLEPKLLPAGQKWDKIDLPQGGPYLEIVSRGMMLHAVVQPQAQMLYRTRQTCGRKVHILAHLELFQGGVILHWGWGLGSYERYAEALKAAAARDGLGWMTDEPRLWLQTDLPVEFAHQLAAAAMDIFERYSNGQRYAILVTDRKEIASNGEVVIPSHIKSDLVSVCVFEAPLQPLRLAEVAGTFIQTAHSNIVPNFTEAYGALAKAAGWKFHAGGDQVAFRDGQAVGVATIEPSLDRKVLYGKPSYIYIDSSYGSTPHSTYIYRIDPRPERATMPDAASVTLRSNNFDRIALRGMLLGHATSRALRCMKLKDAQHVQLKYDIGTKSMLTVDGVEYKVQVLGMVKTYNGETTLTWEWDQVDPSPLALAVMRLGASEGVSMAEITGIQVEGIDWDDLQDEFDGVMWYLAELFIRDPVATAPRRPAPLLPFRIAGTKQLFLLYCDIDIKVTLDSYGPTLMGNFATPELRDLTDSLDSLALGMGWKIEVHPLSVQLSDGAANLLVYLAPDGSALSATLDLSDGTRTQWQRT